MRKKDGFTKREQKKSSVKELRVLPTNMQKVLLLFQTLSKPSRTIITGEGGSGASRFKHVVKFK